MSEASADGKLLRLLKKRLPVIGFLGEYDGACFISDIIAGISVALTLIPQSISCAVLAGLPAQYGLYGSFMGCYIYAILGTRKTTNVGPTVIQAILLAPYVLKFGTSISTLVCFLSGVIISVAAVFNLTFIVDFISSPMIDGFMSAVGFTVIGAQIPSFLGVPGGGSTFVDHCVNIVTHITETQPWDALLGTFSLLFLLALQFVHRFSIITVKSTTKTKVFKTILKYLSLSRNALIVIICTVFIASITESGESPPVNTLGKVDEGLPPFTWPNFTVTQGNETLSFIEAVPALAPSIVIPIIIIVEAISTYEAFAFGTSLDVQQEMFATGFCNFVSSFFLSPQIAPSLVRSSVNNAAGVRTTLGSIWTGTLVVLTLEFLTPYFQYLPNTTLAAVIIASIYFVIQIHKQSARLWREKCMRDLAALLTTFFACLIIGQDYGMLFGGLVNALMVVYDAANVGMHCAVTADKSTVEWTFKDSIVTYLYAEKMRKCIKSKCEHANKIVLNGDNVHKIDSTAIKILAATYFDVTKHANYEFVFSNWNDKTVTLLTNLKVDRGCFVNVKLNSILVDANKKED